MQDIMNRTTRKDELSSKLLLGTSELRYRRLFEAAQDGICSWMRTRARLRTSTRS